MRRTVILDPDVEALVARAVREQAVTFTRAVNDAIRLGLGPRTDRAFIQATFDLGFRPGVVYDKALRISGELEDDDLVRKAAGET